MSDALRSHRVGADGKKRVRRRRRRAPDRAGLGVALEQLGLLDPRGLVGLGLLIVGLLLGLLLTGRLGSSSTSRA